MHAVMRYRGKLPFRGSRAKVTDPIREFQTVPCKVVKVDSEHISTAHIEWPEGRQSSESCGCRRSHLIILDVVVVERKEDDGILWEETLQLRQAKTD